MPWKLCVHPLQRPFGRLPFKRMPKNKARKQMQRMPKNKTRKQMQTVLLRQIAKHERKIADQEDLIHDVLNEADEAIELWQALDAHEFEENQLLRDKVQVLTALLRADGYDV